VIVNGQAWRDDSGIPWANEWEDGHYMVVIGLDEKNVYFEDPSILAAGDLFRARSSSTATRLSVLFR